VTALALTLRTIVLWLSLAPVVLTGAVAAQTLAPTYADWVDLLSRANCNADFDGVWDEDEVLSVALMFDQASVQEISDRASLDLYGYVKANNTVAQLDDAREVANTFLALTGKGLGEAERLATDRAFCGLVTLTADEPLLERVEGQEGRKGYYAPDQALAQAVLGLHGCLSGAVDGVFGPQSLGAWNAAAQVLDPTLALAPGGYPSPGEVLRLMAAPAGGAVCRLQPPQSGAEPVFPQAARDLVDLMLFCTYHAPPRPLPGLGRLLAATPQDVFASLLGKTGPACDPASGELLGQMLAWLVLSAATADVGDPARSVAIALSLADSIRQALAQAEPGELSDLLAILFQGAAGLVADPGTAEFGLLLMAALLDQPERFYDGFDPTQEIAVALGHPDLPEAGVLALRAALDRSPFALLDPATLAMRVDAAIAAEDAEASARLALDIGQLVAFSLDYESPDLESPISATSYAGMLRVETTVIMDGIAPLMNLARLVGNQPQAGALLLRDAPTEVNFALATALLEGFSGLPRSDSIVATAAAHMQAAADAGLGMAALRLAQMLEHGLVATDDPEAADHYFRAAAETGQPEALLALARQQEAEGEAVIALDLYARAYGAEGPRVPGKEAVLALAARIDLGLGVFATPEGKALEAAQQRRFVVESLYGYGTLEVAIAFLKGTSGLGPDPSRTVDWLRISIALDRDSQARDVAEGRAEAIDPSEIAPEARRMLADLIRLRPDLASRPMPAGLDPVATDPDRLVADLPLASAAGAEGHDPASAPWLQCGDEEENCVAIALRSATGGTGSADIRPALDWLKDKAAREAEQMRTRGFIASGNGYSPGRAHASAALAEALAFWGDWAGARAAVEPFAVLPFAAEGEARHDQFRRLVARWLEGKTPSVWAEFLQTVRDFAQRGDPQAQEIMALVAAVEAGAAASPAQTPDLDTAREWFAVAEPLGTNSPGLAVAARRLAPLEHAAGNRTRAIELELMALNTDLAKADIDLVLHGEVPAAMTRICGWSHASERLFALAETDLAVTLAELAVNQLQALRASLVGVPEALQLCFRDQVTDHYRWLAGLYLDAGRPADADRVLILLKDFETFRFVNRASEFAAQATVALAPQIDADAIARVILPVQPTVTGQSIRRRELLLKKKQTGSLSTAEGRELAALNESLAVAATARENDLAQIIEAVAAAGRHALAEGLDDGRSIKRHLKELGEDARAAAVQYVVLDQRLGIILTTPVSQRVFFATTLDGAPFSQAALTALTDQFRFDLTSPGRDPRPLARQLHDILLPPDLRAELTAGGIERLILSLDGPLRRIPMAALHDGSQWLVQDFTLTHVTGGTLTEGNSAVTELAGFGLTRQYGAFPALPGVAIELSGIAGEDGAALSATVWMDDDFTRDKLAAALIFGDGFSGDLGVLHLASHFKLGRTEAESFLLLGDGSTLSVADIREGLGADLDFSDLGLLTLSACETGYGGGSDGSELESFAAVAQDAGAGTVAATLWPVQDASIAVLMQDFYRRAFPGSGERGDFAQALAEAQRAMIADNAAVGADQERGAAALDAEAPGKGPAPLGRAHPFHWAPLLLLEGT
jgi:CHAT domain-containing protein/TPR repeat protein